VVEVLVVGREYSSVFNESQIAGSRLRPEADDICDDLIEGPEDDSESVAELGEGLIEAGVDRTRDDGTEDTDEKCSWNFEGEPMGVRGRVLGVGHGDGGRGTSGGGCRGDGGGPC